jgi:hypothetical protein
VRFCWNLVAKELQVLERRLQTTGWVWRWEDDGLVLELPGWVQPAPVIVAVQRGLFD